MDQTTATMIGVFVSAFFGFLGAVVSGVVTIYLAKIAAQQKKDAEVQVKVGEEVKEVKATLAETRVESQGHAAKHVEELAKLANEMNGMKDQLVAATQKAAFAEGAKSETDKAEGK